MRLYKIVSILTWKSTFEMGHSLIGLVSFGSHISKLPEYKATHDDNGDDDDTTWELKISKLNHKTELSKKEEEINSILSLKRDKNKSPELI